MIWLLKQLQVLLTPHPIHGVALLGYLALTRRRAGWWLLLAWCYGMSIPAASSPVLAWLEDQHPPPPERLALAGLPVVVLSAGWVLDGPDGPVTMVGEAGWERLRTGVALARRSGGPLYLAGGLLAPATEPVSASMRRAVEAMGGGDLEIRLETESTDTYENLALLRDPLAGERFLLVTSASHLPRAMAVAVWLGLDAIAVPADRQALGCCRLDQFVPSLAGIERWQIALHELIGWAYYGLRGWR
jgi:uncharacterized SAM-binding protein YcdF (DUF218 family)